MLAEEHPECLHSHSLRSTHTASQRYLTADVRQKNMPPATAHFESHAPRQRSWRDAMPLRPSEALQPEYPEAEITATATPGREASCHSKNIPEARREMISGFHVPALAMRRPRRESFSSMQPQADVDRSRFPHLDQRRQLAALRAGIFRLQARCHAPLDHETNYANRLVQLIAGRGDFRATASVMRRSGTRPAKSRAGRVPSLPMPAIHPPRQPAIPDEGR